jgi:hypothetical protein
MNEYDEERLKTQATKKKSSGGGASMSSEVESHWWISDVRFLFIV